MPFSLHSDKLSQTQMAGAEHSILLKLQNITAPDLTTAILVTIIGIGVGIFIARKINKNGLSTSFFKGFLQMCTIVIPPFFTAILLFISSIIVQESTGNEPIVLVFLFRVILSWFFVALAMLLVSRRFAKWFLGVIIIPLFIFNLFVLWGHGQDLIFVLKHLRFVIGSASFNLYQFFVALLIVAILLRFSKLLTHYSKTKVTKTRDAKTSTRLLVIKAIQVSLYIVIFLVIINSLGIDITTLAVFGGAIGVGLGFGLQKITSNFISGVILLLEKSVKMGDLIELNDGTIGTIKHNSARYTLVDTSQGKEILIPNEDFITQRVTNWTYSNQRSRIEIVIEVSPSADLDLIKKIMLESAVAHPRCLKDPAPTCYLEEITNKTNGSFAKFSLYFWIGDITDGRSAPRSDVIFAIWRKFRESGIKL